MPVLREIGKSASTVLDKIYLSYGENIFILSTKRVNEGVQITFSTNENVSKVNSKFLKDKNLDPSDNKFVGDKITKSNNNQVTAQPGEQSIIVVNPSNYRVDNVKEILKSVLSGKLKLEEFEFKKVGKTNIKRSNINPLSEAIGYVNSENIGEIEMAAELIEKTSKYCYIYNTEVTSYVCALLKVIKKYNSLSNVDIILLSGDKHVYSNFKIEFQKQNVIDFLIFNGRLERL